MTSKKNLLLGIISGICLLLGYYVPNDVKEQSRQVQLSQFQEIFLEKETKLKEELESFNASFSLNQPASYFENLNYLNNESDLSFYVLKNESLVFWSDDKAAFNPTQLTQESNLLKLGNGWYYKQTIQKKDSLFVGLLLIQSEFNHQNKYLRNQLQSDFDFELIQTIRPPSNYGFSIHNGEGLVVFDLQLKSNKVVFGSLVRLQSILVLLGVGLFLFLLGKIFKKRVLKLIIPVLAIILIRLILFYFPPPAWGLLDYFNPNLYAYSLWMPTFGDFILNGLSLFYLVYQLRRNQGLLSKKWISLILLFFGVLLGNYSLQLVNGSIQNSTINFNLNNLFDLNHFSFLSLFVFGIILFSTIILLDLGIKTSLKNWSKSILVGIYSALCFGSVFIFKGSELHWLIYFWTIVPFAILMLNQTKFRPTISILLLLVFMSAITALIINHASQKRENEKRNIIIQKLAEEKDPIAEYLFDKIQEDIRNDTVLIKLFQGYWDNKGVIDGYLSDQYFSGYWKKYSILFTSCKESDSLFVNPSNRKVSCIDYYQNRIRYQGDLISSSNFFQLKNLAGRIDYIAQIELPIDSSFMNLFIEMSANMFNQNNGYPELLIDEKSIIDNTDLKDYSYAVYEQDNLILNAGDFNYSIINKVSELGVNSFYQYTSEDHVHTVFKKNKNVTIVLSRRIESSYDFLTSLAYLLVIFSLLYVCLSLLFPLFPMRLRIIINDFSSRIQLFLIGSLLLALFMFGVGTTYYIQKQNQEKNFKNISEKIRSVNIELTNKIGGEEQLDTAISSYVTSMLVKFSNVFYTDINLYDTTGILFASSRPEIFSKGLKGNRMNPQAFRGLILNQKAEWVQNEQVGSLEYLSAYIPFKNDDNEIIAYLNLPYFTKQGELQQEISTFLVSTINIYVAIFALSLLISVLLINQLSRPLLMIRKQISHLKLGGKLELIEWNSNDEIGSLVKEYNRMIVELSVSAEQLAQSERESAWREMAKQVAHEIKNPLTPMKLSIQHLQLAYERGSEDLEDRIKRTTKTLVEQIETLSNIATEFSHFAKMPEKKFELVDLIGIINTTVDLFEAEVSSNIQLNTKFQEVIISADRDQLIRLFNNLIKNSLQAESAERRILIEINVTEIDMGFQVAVGDNGIGIKEDQKDRIFEPSFTTKTSGTGIGLAMSKKIMENLNGKIEISSEENVGTTFTLSFPKA